jgi:hypothetical protein
MGITRYVVGARASSESWLPILTEFRQILNVYLQPVPAPVPITLKHFQALARLGSAAVVRSIFLARCPLYILLT